MLQDYMCSNCGLEYPTHDEQPEACPHCKCTDRVAVTFPATDGALHGSWEDTEWDQPDSD